MQICKESLCIRSFTCKQKAVELLLDVSSVESGTEDLTFNLIATSTGTEQTPNDNINILTLPLKTQADIHLSGLVISLIHFINLAQFNSKRRGRYKTLVNHDCCNLLILYLT
jgi:hypothetical protein